jgi:hypothetical protein
MGWCWAGGLLAERCPLSRRWTCSNGQAVEGHNTLLGAFVVLFTLVWRIWCSCQACCSLT